MDIHTNAQIFAACHKSIKRFLDRGGILVWGIIPTGFETYAKENLEFQAMTLELVWKELVKKGIDMDQILAQSMLSPATCCLVNPDGEQTVEKAFHQLKDLSKMLKTKYKLS